MPVPFEYDNAGPQFQQLLRDARDFADLHTTNQSFTMVEGVLLVFRKRLTTDEVFRFANVLPAVARAIFVARFDVTTAPVGFGDMVSLTREVQGHRGEHNYAPETCISNVAAALRRNVDERRFDACLATFDPEARDYWTPSDADANRTTIEHSFSGPLRSAPLAARPGSDRRHAR